MFDFNNINNIDNENVTDVYSSLALVNILRNVDALLDLAESRPPAEIQTLLLDYIGKENLRDTLIALGNTGI